MSETTMVLGLAAIFAVHFYWGFRVLPDERWQFLATAPVVKNQAGDWQGRNYTYYGVFQANACTLAVALWAVMMATLGVSGTASLGLAAAVFVVCLPAASLIARIVERQRHTLTVGGASFLGFLLAPAVICVVNSVASNSLPCLPTLAAITTSYAVGEGVGRLACISFGCCYGKPLDACPAAARRLLGSWRFVFSGSTKKAAYEAGLEGVPLFPIQGLTALILTTTGLICLWLFLRGHFLTALVVSVAVTQLWRFASEFFRADFRNMRRVSVYQLMALFLLPYLVGIGAWASLSGASPAQPGDALAALATPWSPLSIIVLQALWLAVFLYTGRSTVTGSTMTFSARCAR